MSEETNTETTKPLIKKENTLPVIAIAISGVALVASLFTVGAASAQPNHAPDRQFSNSQQMGAKDSNKHQAPGANDQQRGKHHGDRQRMGQDTLNQTTPKQDGAQHSAPQQMPKMNGQTGAS